MATVSQLRWRFIDPNNVQEVAERQAIIAKIDAWWQAFRSEQATIVRSFKPPSGFPLADWMHEHLNAIHPELMWEFGQAVHGPGHRLVITPETDHHLRPLVRAILERAPVIDGWEFYEYRLAEKLESTLATFDSRVDVDVSDYKVQVSRGTHHCIDLKFGAASIPNADDQASNSAAFVIAETLLGEACLNDWIGVIEVAPLPTVSGIGRLFGRGERERRHFVCLDRMQETVKALIDGISEQLPPQPHYQWLTEGAEWNLWQLTPVEAEDYPNQDDMFVGKSASSAMWRAAHSGCLFKSERFSRCGETFCYLKIDGADGLEGSTFGDKAEIEDALDEVLKPAGLGCHIGGGTGRRYSYIDLALTDLDQAIAAIRQCLQAGNVPKRSWIQFFDTDLAAEWVGVYDETPEPPLAVS